jgi:hypothetical protein
MCINSRFIKIHFNVSEIKADDCVYKNWNIGVFLNLLEFNYSVNKCTVFIESQCYIYI